ncbi:ASCH domain-containing protein [Bacillus sp. SCS-153A]|uniref:ASCH domain-containing protein n=1 Tax=Rossellomorea sedimentorum TaxID=3115294 RepID=UPI003905FF6C
MVHKMGLYEEYFQSILKRDKKVEVRLNDEKRRKINAGDKIEFIKIPEQSEKLIVQVTGIKKYDSFKEMYEDIPLKEFGCEGRTMEEVIGGTYEIYTPEQEKEWGVLAIRISH